VNKKFSTRYYLNLVLIDEENRRYFKQQEITIYREPEAELEPLPATEVPQPNDHVQVEAQQLDPHVPV
jgi:hypothetical protein